MVRSKPGLCVAPSVYDSSFSAIELTTPPCYVASTPPSLERSPMLRTSSLPIVSSHSDSDYVGDEVERGCDRANVTSLRISLIQDYDIE
jgi:hypothetical protein